MNGDDKLLCDEYIYNRLHTLKKVINLKHKTKQEAYIELKEQIDKRYKLNTSDYVEIVKYIKSELNIKEWFYV